MTAILRHLTLNPGYDFDALRLFEAMTVKPDGRRKRIVSGTIMALKQAGVWEKKRGLFVAAAHDRQAGRINWKNPSEVATEVNSPTFTVDRGFASDGTTSYIDTGINANAAGIYTRNDAHIGCYALTLPGTGLRVPFGVTNAATWSSGIAQNVAGVSLLYRMNDAQALTATPFTVGHYIGVRRGANSVEYYKNGVSVFTGAQASVALTANSFWLNGQTGGLYDGIVSFGHFGSQLNVNEQRAITAIMTAYLRGVGAA